MNRNRLSVLLSLLLVITCSARAQDYIIEGVTPNLYLSHSVAAKETWYSIGRLYNLPPKDIAVYNKMSITRPLEIGQQVHVPLTAANFSQADAGSDKTFIPVYHVVQPKEWLYRISVNYNKVPVEKLQKWNSIGKDGARPGTRLIVGYLKVKDANAALAGAPHEEATPKAVLPPARKADDTPATAPAKATPPPIAQTPEPAAASQSQGGRHEGSYFKNLFEDNGRSASGIAGIFKSTSGWNDGKYYALVSNVPVGTIIRITYPATSKSVYAKVLGELPDMKESEGLALRISDAAASELGSTDNKFTVSFRY